MGGGKYKPRGAGGSEGLGVGVGWGGGGWRVRASTACAQESVSFRSCVWAHGVCHAISEGRSVASALRSLFSLAKGLTFGVLLVPQDHFSQTVFENELPDHF